MKSAIFKIKDYLKFKSQKRINTLSGALVFFIGFSLVPTVYILSLALSLFKGELRVVLNPNFLEISTVLDYALEASLRLGASGNILIVLVAIYSSSNSLYQLKLVGETLYSCTSKNKLKGRVFSIIFTPLFVLLIALLSALLTVFSTRVLSIFEREIVNAITAIALSLAWLFIVVLINFYACPFKTNLKCVLPGSVYTAILSVLETLIFIIYIRRFASIEKIYGIISALFVFISWLYLVIKTVVSGITLNAYRLKNNNEKSVDYKA